MGWIYQARHGIFPVESFGWDGSILCPKMGVPGGVLQEFSPLDV
jgi:hypothetical protein